nr:hypothetical protein [Tanacetum cinerariifolium]
MSSYYEFNCYGCGRPSDTPVCYLCTSEQCGNILNYGTCLNCNSGIRNSFTYDPIPESFDEISPNPPPEFHFNIYLCQICESNSHYGYECSQRVLLFYEPEPCYIQNFSDNDYSHDLPSVEPLIDHHCCYECGNSLIDFFCPHFTCKFCGNDAHVGYNYPAQVPSFQTLPSFPQHDAQSLSGEDFPEEIFSNPLFEEEIISTKIDPHHFDPESDLIESMLNHDSSIIFSSLKIDSLLEFVSENSNSDIESFSPSPIPIKDSDSLMEEIDLSYTPDDPMPPDIEDDDYESERDIQIHEELLNNYSLLLPVIKSYHFDIPSFFRPLAKPPDGNTGILNIKMMGDISNLNVPIPNLTITHVSNHEKSPDLLSHRSVENFQLSAKHSMMILGKNIPILDVPLFHFYPLDQFKYGGIGSSSAT